MNKIRTMGGAPVVPPTKALPWVNPMKPFLELPMIIENNEQASKRVTVRIQPCEIAYYYPGFHTGVIVVMNSGSSYLLDMESNDFDQALMGYATALIQNPGAFGNLSIKPKTKIDEAY